MFKTKYFSSFLLMALLAVSPAGAQPMAEWLGLAPDGASVADFGTASLSTLPADFFGPGSDPFDGQVTFGPADNDLAAIENVLRLLFPEPPMSPIDPPSHGRTIPTEIIELRLVSSAPVVIGYSGGMITELWDVEMSLSPTTPPAGNTSAFKIHENGGTFDSYLPVQPSFRFTRVSDGTALDWDTGFEGLPALELTLVGGRFVHEADPLLHMLGENNGLYVGGVEELVAGDPASQCPAMMLASTPDGGLILELLPVDDAIQPDAFVAIPGDEPGGCFVAFENGDHPPLPAGFFGPGSDPFDGGVPLTGEPLGPNPWGDYEDADTLIRRFGHPFDRCDVPDALVSEGVNIEILALSLRSLEPITVTYDGGQSPELWDIQMRLEPDGTQAGYMYVTKTHENGGTYDSYFIFQPRFIFTRQSDGQQVIEDASVSGRPALDFRAQDGQWVHFARPDLYLLAPSQGRFVPCVSEEIPGDPATQIDWPQHGFEYYDGGTLSFRLARRDMTGVETPTVPSIDLSAHPNPFNPVTTIAFELTREGPVVLRILDLSGRVVRTLVHEVLPAGSREITWRALDDTGRRVASGVYLGVLETREGVRTCKLAVIK